MIRQLQLLILLVVGNAFNRQVLCSPNENPLHRSSSSAALHRSIFGVRGGASFFGFGKSSKSQDGGSDGDDPKRYPALTKQEIEEKLNIPVFGLTDEAGHGVILTSPDDSNIVNFFFSRADANAALEALKTAHSPSLNTPTKLRVSVFHLGKIWFKLISNPHPKFNLLKCGKDVNSEDEDQFSEQVVQCRLIPNAKDLMGARVLAGLKPSDMEQLKEAVANPDLPKAMAIVKKAAQNASSFTSPFNHIPVFSIAQMRVRQKDSEGNGTGASMLPVHLSSKTMSDTWNEFVHTSPQFADAEATLTLIELHKMIDMMQCESDFDFRNIVFVMPEYDKDVQKNELDDSDDDDSDDNGGGDNGMNARCNEISVEPFFEPFVSMEVFADTTAGQSPVEL